MNEMLQCSINNRISFYHVNTRSLNSNFDKLQISLNSIHIPFTAIGVTETWFRDDDTLYSLYDLQGYKTEYSSRVGRGGGVALYINESYDYFVRPDLTIFLEGFLESLFIELVTSHRTSVLVGVIYCPTGINSDVIEKLTPVFESSEASRKGCVLMGDFNCNLMSTNGGDVNMFMNLVHSNAFEILHTLPTRITGNSATLLDIMLTNINQPCTPGILVDDISDHFPVFTVFETSCQRKTRNTVTYCRKYTRRNISYFQDLISNENWQHVYLENHTDDAFDKFLSTFLQHFDNCFPKSVNRNNNVNNSSGQIWMSTGIANSCKTKHKLYKKYVRKRTNENFIAYKAFRNRLTSVIRIAKKLYYNEMFDNCENDIKKTWSSINSIVYGKSKDKPIEENSHNGTTIRDSLVIGNVFNDFFTSVGTRIQSMFLWSLLPPLVIISTLQILTLCSLFCNHQP
ncbi:hypothetical protein HOLleu_13768 [Holothuria leucospilota]|uniref:Endonuclease/exonuclease/phosphatase domain-containing protein n=1 Tax=Holothuria leucospilota TaxID=206669 RepID=A0A9Q1H8H9_HOLLE|nr:hypothetical protein HOLleu_13768 [Holothuria leucospilota]